MTVTTSVFAGRDGDIHARCVSLDTNSEREREREREIQKLVASVPFFSSSSSSSRYFDDDENSKNEIYRDYNFIVFMYCC